ncbi:hypothetical protein QBC34DRAFT_405744 [Podospora aff. communis PSN243]|uniref:NAD(P)-binding domain-containing protein n=1 Tax=Podospora aff. communis PSN243 TaxID=3040156 RepID=A0AAV9GRU1_9PEZI|nr:hypothetical protein QBC34DRAFT_405744 [Podospora aff. communis PSN243]
MATAEAPLLILGGTGTVGSRIVQQLASSSIPALVASRSGSGKNGVIFDWLDRETWNNPYDKGDVRAVYLIAPPMMDAASVMMDFVDFARGKGTKRFVLQSASAIEPGGPAMGKVHAYLRELGTRGEVDWAVLRPTWFQENLGVQENHVRSIRDESKIYSASADGKIPWVSADDIAAVAVQMLTRQEPANTECLILGPELLGYDDLAAILSEILHRKIIHVDLSTAALAKRHQSFGMPESFANMLSSMDTAIKFGAENRTNDVVLSITGVPPKSFRKYAESVKSVWEPLTVA